MPEKVNPGILNGSPTNDAPLGDLYQVYIGLGSNIDPVSNLTRAMDLLRQRVTVKTASSVWETFPAEGKGPNFLNATALILTHHTSALLKTLVLREIEVQLGRVRTANKHAPRTIDLDILIYDGKVIDPKVWTEAFIAVPLAELIGDYRHPDTQETLKEVSLRLAKAIPIKSRPDVILEIQI